MIWTILSALICSALVIKLVFFTDRERRCSRWFYRFTLFLVAIYAGHEVISILYQPYEPVSVTTVLVQTWMLAGSFVLKAHHLPWNTTHDPVHKVDRYSSNTIPWLW